MTIDNIYGFETTDDIQLESQGLPIGTYKVMIVGEEADQKGRGVVVDYEIIDETSEFKGKTGKVWYLTKHESAQTANIAKSNIKRIADATGKPVAPMTPLKNRVLTLEVRQQKKNPQYTEVAKYLPENYEAEVEIPM
jgi:hypothetical protein